MTTSDPTNRVEFVLDHGDPIFVSLSDEMLATLRVVIQDQGAFLDVRVDRVNSYLIPKQRIVQIKVTPL